MFFQVFEHLFCSYVHSYIRSSVRSEQVINADLSPPSATEVSATADPEEEGEEDDGYGWTVALLPVGGVILILVVGYLVARGDVCYCRNCWG